MQIKLSSETIKIRRAFAMPLVAGNFRQNKDLNRVVATAQLE